LYYFFIAFNFTNSELVLLVLILDDVIHQQDDQVPLTTEEHNVGDECVEGDNEGK
jgi:hypothetical protein